MTGSALPVTYFGVELQSTEQPVKVAHLICKTADEVGTRFQRLEILEIISVGGRKFLRCRCDVLNPYPMLERILQQGRGTILARDRGYTVIFGEKSGPVSTVVMHSTPRVGQHVCYRGPKIKFWARQFE